MSLQRRHELTDDQWQQLAPLLPPQRPSTGRPARDHRTVLNGIVWIVRSGAPRRDLPERYGRWKTVYSRFRRWRKAGFETACQANGIALYVLPPRSPKLNGRVERRNGTARREFWECDDGDLDLPTLQQALQAWEIQDNTVRPHQALRYATPHAHLASLNSQMS